MSEALLISDEKPAVAVKKARNTNTERSREYRLAKKQSGGFQLSVFIGTSASAAMQIIRAHSKLTQAKAIEDALILRAMQISSDAKTTYGYFLGGGIDAACAQAWDAHCEKTKQFSDLVHHAGHAGHAEGSVALSTHSGIQN